MKHKQLVNIAPFTTSSSGSITKKRRARPTMCIDSKTHTTRKSENDERLHDLKTQILAERKAVPNKSLIIKISVEYRYYILT